MLILDSITFAHKARDYLMKKGIQCYIERIPKHLHINGCGYGLRVDRDAGIIAEMLRDAGIRVKNIIDIQ